MQCDNVFASLGVRARKMLAKLNIETIDELARFSESDLLSINNCGHSTIAELRAFLSTHGRTSRPTSASEATRLRLSLVSRIARHRHAPM